MKINFVMEFNSIMRYSRNENLSLRERALWVALFYLANDRARFDAQEKDFDWPDDYFSVANGELNLYCCLDKRGIEMARNQLRQRGVIDFKPGFKNRQTPAYRLNYLSPDVGYKTVPNDVPKDAPNDIPKDVPNHVPNDVPNDVPNHVPNDVPKDAPFNLNKGTPKAIPFKTDVNQREAGTGLADLSGEARMEGLL